MADPEIVTVHTADAEAPTPLSFEEVDLFDTALLQGGHNVSAPPVEDDDAS